MPASYTTIDGDMLDNICFKHYGSATDTITPVYLANPALSAHGPVLHAGITIVLPDVLVSEELSFW